MHQRQIENFNFVDIETNVFTLIIKMLQLEKKKKRKHLREAKKTLKEFVLVDHIEI